MSHDNRIAEPDASSSYKIKEIATGSRVRSTEREQYVTFSTYKRMDDRMRTALDRNLQFAAVRVGIKTELRGIARMALRRLKANAASQGNLEQTQLMEKADTCARRLELCRAMVRLKASHAAWRLLCARADRQFRLMALMAGFFRMKAELIAAVRELRKERRRARRQYRALLELHARLLLVRWHQQHSRFAATMRIAATSISVRRRLFCRSALCKWRQGVARRHEGASLGQRADVLHASILASNALWYWRDSLASNRRFEYAVGRAGRRGRRTRLVAAWSHWLEAARKWTALQRAQERAARRVDAKARTRLLRCMWRWRRLASRRTRACALARRALGRLHRHARCARKRARTERLLSSHLLVSYRARRLQQWALSARLRSYWRTLGLAAASHARARIARQLAKGFGWWSGELMRRQAVRERHAICHRRFVRFGARKAIHQWWGSCTDQLVEDWLTRRADGWQLLLWLARWHAAYASRRKLAAAMRGRLHAARMWLGVRTKRLAMRDWLQRAAPLAEDARWVVELRLRLAWRRTAGSFFTWRRGIKGVFQSRLNTTRAEDAFRRRACLQALDAWGLAAARRRRWTMLCSGLFAVLGRTALHEWADWAEAHAEYSAILETRFGRARRYVSTRRRTDAFGEWVSRYDAKRAIDSRLWAKQVSLQTAKSRASRLAALRVWQRKALLRRRRGGWLRLAEGHRLVRQQRVLLRRWAARTRARMARYAGSSPVDGRATSPRGTSPALPWVREPSMGPRAARTSAYETSAPVRVSSSGHAVVAYASSDLAKPSPSWPRYRAPPPLTSTSAAQETPGIYLHQRDYTDHAHCHHRHNSSSSYSAQQARAAAQPPPTPPPAALAATLGLGNHASQPPATRALLPLDQLLDRVVVLKSLGGRALAS